MVIAATGDRPPDPALLVQVRRPAPRAVLGLLVGAEAALSAADIAKELRYSTSTVRNAIDAVLEPAGMVVLVGVRRPVGGRRRVGDIMRWRSTQQGRVWLDGLNGG